MLSAGHKRYDQIHSESIYPENSSQCRNFKMSQYRPVEEELVVIVVGFLPPVPFLTSRSDSLHPPFSCGQIHFRAAMFFQQRICVVDLIRCAFYCVVGGGGLRSFQPPQMMSRREDMRPLPLFPLVEGFVAKIQHFMNLIHRNRFPSSSRYLS